MIYSSKKNNNKNVEIKQNFLACAISDISAYIQLSDTKVSIIMGAVVAILVGFASCYDSIERILNKISLCNWSGILLYISIIVGVMSVILTFVFGLLTVKGRSCVINYRSNWYLNKSTEEYSFIEFTRDIQHMTDQDVIINMAAELYKLNDINRQKLKTVKYTMISFSVFLIVVGVVGLLLLISSI